MARRVRALSLRCSGTERARRRRRRLTMDMKHNSLIRVLAVDDHPTFREGLVFFVGGDSDIKLVAEATNGREAVEQFRQHCPEITLMDLQMGTMNGNDSRL